MSYHSAETTGSIHYPYNWTYADQSTREGASGFIAGDIGKFARQLDDNTLWMLVATTPTWVSVRAASFLDLDDTPSSYSGQASKFVAVNSGASALEFVSSTSTEASALIVDVVKATSGTITVGQVVRVIGWSETYDCAEVELAKADSGTTLPACGFATQEITDTVSGNVVIQGRAFGIDTSTFAEGACLWLSAATAGAAASTRPTTVGHYVQILGSVVKAAEDGVIRVSPHPPASYLMPNIAQNKYWVGDATNQSQPQWIRDSYSVESNAESSTTGTTYIQKVRLSFTPIAAGDYEINFSFLIGTSNTGFATNSRVWVDSSTVKKEIMANLTSAYPNMHGRGGNFMLYGLTAAAHTVDIEYCSASAGKSTYITEAVITARRIGQS